MSKRKCFDLMLKIVLSCDCWESLIPDTIHNSNANVFYGSKKIFVGNEISPDCTTVCSPDILGQVIKKNCIYSKYQNDNIIWHKAFKCNCFLPVIPIQHRLNVLLILSQSWKMDFRKGTYGNRPFGSNVAEDCIERTSF